MNDTLMLDVKDWPRMIQGLRSGNVYEVSDEVWDYFLGVLPPVNMGKVIFVPGYNESIHTSFGFAEGTEEIVYFWREAGTDSLRAWKSQEVNRG